MNHGRHSFMMIALLAVGAILLLTGNVGGLLFVLWPLACVAMMVWMMWAMRGMGRGAPGPGPADSHDDCLTHPHT